METISIPKSEPGKLFKFSEPLQVTNLSKDFSNEGKNEGSYKFSAPLNVLSSGAVVGNLPVNSSALTGFGKQFKRSRKEWECNVCMIYNTSELEKCVACATPRSATILPVGSSFGQQFKKSADKWECDTCMIQNSPEKTSCIACETPRKGICKSEADEGFKTLASQQKASKWECSTCMTQNENNCIKCVCCEQAKPGHTKKTEETQSLAVGKFSFGFGNGTNGPTESDLRKASTAETAEQPANQFKFGFTNLNTTPSDVGFKALASQQKASKWECSTCMTQNDNNCNKCVCCEQQKPNQETKEKLSTLSAPSAFTFGFGNSSTTVVDAGFKALASQQKASKWECSSCMTQNDFNKVKCVCCEEAKPGVVVLESKSENSKLPQTATTTNFRFGFFPEAKASTENEITKEKEKSTSEANNEKQFKFGFTPNTPKDIDFKALAAQQKSSKWECSTCMTQNDTDKTKCVCCEEVKPGGKTLEFKSGDKFAAGANAVEETKKFKFGFTPDTKTDPGFKALADQQKKSKWECDACMTQNDTNLLKCACCEQVKPGERIEIKSSLQNEVSAPKFRFGFGNGSDAPTEEELRKKI